MNPPSIPWLKHWKVALGIFLHLTVGVPTALAVTISGTVYTDEGSTNIGLNKTVNLEINGVTGVNTDETDANGAYSITPASGPAAGDVVTLYLNDETQRAVTVSISDGTNDTGVNLWVDRLILRHENAGPVTDTTLNTANNGGDTDYTLFIKAISSNTNASVGSDVELLIWTGATFRPAGTVTALSGVDINGTFTMQTYTVTSSGSFDAGNDGVFTGTNTVLLSAKTGTLSVITNGSTFYNLTFGDSGGTARWRLGDNIDINGSLSISGGRLDVTSSSYQTNLSGNFLISSGSFVPWSGMVILDGYSQTLSGAILLSGLSKKNVSGATLTFRQSRQVIVEDYLTLRGKEDRQMKIDRSGSSAAGFLRLNTGGTQDIMFLDVTQNNASGGVELNCRSGCVDSGSNTNWSFTTRTVGEGGSYGQVIVPGF